ncbi:SMI1/KNR4 family protein [Chitinophaga filiformis]|uniref:SMI1/KNR4 family protein n=1 Tax=Chitinophaga filiformis TaxID=104663 RepID=A0ABY4I0W5_CHIFI|nr:SMI1/KNR4 family protein [Chitinophaga filiformis]UPK68396.1 SMI1/KNR4 family protein [Chitinophaga filiformis]
MAAEYRYMNFLLGYKEHAEEEDACTEEEVRKIEEKLGVKFPQSYREVYLILGEWWGFNFIDDNSYQFPQFEEMRAGAENIIARNKTDFVLDKNMFVFGCFLDNAIVYFFKLDEGDDPPVYWYQGGVKDYELLANSFSSFVEAQAWYKGYLLIKKDKESGRT